MGIIDDSLNEKTEQFELYFANLDSDYATAGDPEIACIIIQDNGEKTTTIGDIIFNH